MALADELSDEDGESPPLTSIYLPDITISTDSESKERKRTHTAAHRIRHISDSTLAASDESMDESSIIFNVDIDSLEESAVRRMTKNKKGSPFKLSNLY